MRRMSNGVIPGLLLMLTLAGRLNHFQGIQSEATCYFPAAWNGRWYQNRLGDVIIRDNVMLEKGICLEHKRDYFLLEDTKRHCSLCLLMIQRHENIIQYRESFCVSGNLRDVCAQLRLEAPLYTLIRDNSQPVSCPFKDVLRFVYNNNTGGFCRQPTSYIEACASESKFHFRFRHCNDVTDSIDQDLEFECLATWKDGSDKFLYGGFSGTSITRRDHVYRCFMYEHFGSEMYMSMSADASCQGLRTPRDGPLVMDLVREPSDVKTAYCLFPAWFRSTTWRDMPGVHLYASPADGSTIETKHSRLNTWSTQFKTMKFQCLRTETNVNTSTIAAVLTFHGCQVYYQCIRLNRLHHDVTELSQGPSSEEQITDCSTTDWNITRTMLISESSAGRPCPHAGHYQMSHVTPSQVTCLTRLHVGCNQTDLITVDNSCIGSAITLQCVTEWQRNSQHHVVWRRINNQRPAATCMIVLEQEHGISLRTAKLCNPDDEYIGLLPTPAVLNGTTQHFTRITDITECGDDGATSNDTGRNTSNASLLTSPFRTITFIIVFNTLFYTAIHCSPIQ